MKRVLPVAIAFVVLLALVVVKEMRRLSFDEGGAAGGEFFPLAASKFETKDVAKIEVFPPGGTEPAFTIERDGGRWLVTKPFRAPGHANQIEKLADALATGDAELRADDAGALRDFDLVPERAVQVKATGADGRTLAHLAVGRTTGSRGAFVRFLANAGDVKAYETTADLRAHLGLMRTQPGEAEPEAPKRSHFLDLAFPAMKLEDPKRIEVVAPGRRVVLEKKGAAWEAVEGGPGLPVNTKGVEQVLQSVGPEFHAKDLADPADLAKLGLAEPKHVLAVTTAGDGVKRIFGSAVPSLDTYYARIDAKQDPDVIYEATAWEWQRIFPSGAALFTFEAVNVPEETYTKLVVEKSGAGASRIEIVRDGTKPADEWRIVAPDWPLAVRQSSLRSLASLARNVKPVDWVDSTDIGPAETVVRAGPAAAADGDLVTIRIGGRAPHGKDRLAALPGRGNRVFVLADSTVDRLVVSPTSLFEPKVLHGWTEADVASVRVEKASGDSFAADFAIEKGETGWTLVRGEIRSDASPDAAKQWVEALLALETREPADASGPAEARVTVVKKDGTSRSVTLSPAKDGMRSVTLGTLVFPTDRTDLLPAADALAAKPAPATPPNGGGDVK